MFWGPSKRDEKYFPTLGKNSQLWAKKWLSCLSSLFSLLFSLFSFLFPFFVLILLSFSSLLFSSLYIVFLSLSFLFLLLSLSSSASSHFSLPSFSFPFKHSHFAAKSIKLLGFLLNQHWSPIEIVFHGAQISTEPYWNISRTFKIQLFQWQACLNKSYWCEPALSGIPRMLCNLPLWCSMGQLRSILIIPEKAVILEQIVKKREIHVVEVKEGWEHREQQKGWQNKNTTCLSNNWVV